MSQSFLSEALQGMVIKDIHEEAAAKVEHSQEAARRRAEQNARIRAAKNEDKRDDGSDSETDEEDRLLLDDDGALEEIRRRRMAALKARVAEKKQRKALGAGDYREIKETEFLEEVKKGKVMCLFFHNEFDTCKLLDKHLSILCPLHDEIKIIKINAEKAPFFVHKLSIRVLPTLVFFEDGVTNPAMRIMGFDGIENGDKCSTRDLEETLVSLEVFEEAVVSEDATPESLREQPSASSRGGDEEVDWDEVRGAKEHQRSGALYGFNRGYDSDSD